MELSETIDNLSKESENNSNTLSEYEQRIINKEFGLCSDCNQPKTEWNWCQHCNSKRFQQNFDKWTSGNDTIDKFIQDAQLNADNNLKVIEWIPYDIFQDIKQIAKGGYSTIYYAKWVGGYIKNWDIKDQRWIREDNYEVALKKFDSIVDINEDFLNEVNKRYIKLL